MSLDYGSLNEIQKKYVFAVVPQLDDLDPEQFSNFAAVCNGLESINIALNAIGMGPVAVRNGYLHDWEVFEGNSTMDDAHKNCAAIDIDDFDGALFNALVNGNLLSPAGFYAADNSITAGYIHLQVTSPPNGERVFIP